MSGMGMWVLLRSSYRTRKKDGTRMTDSTAVKSDRCFGYSILLKKKSKENMVNV